MNGRVTVTEFVTNSVRERILSGEYAPGTKLDQHVLVSEFGASLIPVRESLRQLEAQGFVQLYPHRGAYVSEVSLDKMQEIYLIREMLEELATRLAVPNLTQTDLAKLSSVEEAWGRAVRGKDYARILALATEFSFVIYNASKKPLLCQTIQGLWDRSQLYRQLTVQMPSHLQHVVRNYGRILKAIKQGDAEAAAQGVRANLHQTVISFMEHFSEKDMARAVAKPKAISPNNHLQRSK
ncbi:MAG: GntR family transcriptional regulator [Anaerolineae bacterium]|nr:GntR family transcriptional regulator [Anaerolineae bacterium]